VASTHAGSKILVVEDSPVNQRVALGLLEKLGYAVDVVDNGREGLEMLDRGRYAAVLMDCLMPELDGYTATVELRRREAASGRRRTPVIALTASARDEDRQRCLESGMDDFLSKPIRGANLSAVLERWTGGPDGASHVPEPSGRAIRPEVCVPDGGPASALPAPLPSPALPAVTLNPAALGAILELEQLGRAGLFDEMLALFRQEGVARLAELRAALAKGDARVAQRLAHTMKGEALSWGANELASISEQIETDAGLGRLGTMASDLKELARLFDATVVALDGLRPSLGEADRAESVGAH
jgi:CheY-like chemotaxis protein